MAFKVPEKYRLKTGVMASSSLDGNNGVFLINSFAKAKAAFTVIASDGAGWEHVSVSLPHRAPTWDEMCFIKNLFWSENDCVIQYHPPKSEYVNNHKFCLHLWRPVNQPIVMPPSIMVGIRDEVA